MAERIVYTPDGSHSAIENCLGAVREISDLQTRIDVIRGLREALKRELGDIDRLFEFEGELGGEVEDAYRDYIIRQMDRR